MENKITNSFLKDYIKCAAANKVTLAGYLSLATGLCIHSFLNTEESGYLQHLAYATTNMGSTLLISTLLGIQTFETYRETRNKLKKFGNIKEIYQKVKNKAYCTRVGMELAAKESGLEKFLGETK